MAPILSRATALSPSHRSKQGDRPTLQAQFDSLAVEPNLLLGTSVTLVDDVVTKGTTLLAAASRLADVHPRAELRALALVRTTGTVDDIDDYIEPTVGVITLNRWGRAEREP